MIESSIAIAYTDSQLSLFFSLSLDLSQLDTRFFLHLYISTVLPYIATIIFPYHSRNISNNSQSEIFISKSWLRAREKYKEKYNLTEVNVQSRIRASRSEK